MIAEFRRKPSLARRKAIAQEKSAELERIVAEEMRRAFPRIDIVTFRNGVQVN
jgi:hypothetical protein